MRLCITLPLAFAAASFVAATATNHRTTASGTNSSSVLCTNLFPGTSVLQYPIDLSTYDPYAPQPNQNQQIPVFEMTCNDNRTQTISATGVSYQVPDFVPPIAGEYGSVTSFTQHTFESVVQMANYFSLNVHVGGSLLSGSVSASFASAMKFLLNTGGSISLFSTYVSAWEPVIPHFPWSKYPPLSSWAANFVENALAGANCTASSGLTESCNAVVQEFISSFGTHYINSTCQGCGILAGYATSREYLYEYGSVKAASEAALNFKSFLHASGGISDDFSASTTWQQASSSWNEEVVGGFGSPTSASTFATWEQSCYTSTHVVPCRTKWGFASLAGPLAAHLRTVVNLDAAQQAAVVANTDAAFSNYYYHQYLVNTVIPGLKAAKASALALRPSGDMSCNPTTLLPSTHICGNANTYWFLCENCNTGLDRGGSSANVTGNLAPCSVTGAAAIVAAWDLLQSKVAAYAAKIDAAVVAVTAIAKTQILTYDEIAFAEADFVALTSVMATAAAAPVECVFDFSNAVANEGSCCNCGAGAGARVVMATLTHPSGL